MHLRKNHCSLLILAALPFLFSVSCSKKTVQTGPDINTPKEAALTFAKAMVAGDNAGMQAISVGTDGHVFAFYTSLAEVVQAQHRFTAALKAKFGDDFKLPDDIEAIGKLNPLPVEYDKLTEKIEGDTASLLNPNGLPGVRLKKVAGMWKVDFEAADEALPPDGPARMAQQQEIFAATKKAFDEVTAKIESGVYSDGKTAVDDVKLPAPPPPSTPTPVPVPPGND